MRITIINQFYPPDISPTAKLAASLANHRAALGDSVTVIAGQGYVSETAAGESSGDENVRIQRVWIPKLGKKGLWRRCFASFMFFALSTWQALRLPRQDVVICLTTPPFILGVGAIHKLLHRRTRLILWNMDCYPEVAERVGVIATGGVAARLLQALNLSLSAWLDGVVCLDEAMRQLVLTRPGTESSRLPASVIPNWEPLVLFPWQTKDEENFHEPESQSSGLPTASDFTVLYTGNMGHGHCFETMIEAAQRLSDQNADARFTITGGGVKLPKVRQEAQQRDLKNIELLGYVSIEKLRALQSTASCSLITLRDDMLGVMSPSKLHASLAMGLPIIYVGPRGSNADEAIRRFGCGVSLRHGDVDGFVDFVHELNENQLARAAYRARSRAAFETAYCDQRVLPKFDRVIESIIGSQLAPVRKAA